MTLNWKGIEPFSNQVVITSTHIRPFTNKDITNSSYIGFGLPRPIKHYRRGRHVTNENINNREVKSSKGSSLGGGSGGLGLIGNLISNPGSFITKNSVYDLNTPNTDCVDCNGIKLSSNWYPDSKTTICRTNLCNPEKKAIRRILPASTIVKKDYSQTHSAYLYNNCQTFKQREFNFVTQPSIMSDNECYEQYGRVTVELTNGNDIYAATSGNGLVYFKVNNVWETSPMILFETLDLNETVTSVFNVTSGIPTAMKLTCSNNDGFYVETIKINGTYFDNIGWVDIDSTEDPIEREYDLTNLSGSFPYQMVICDTSTSNSDSSDKDMFVGQCNNMSKGRIYNSVNITLTIGGNQTDGTNDKGLVRFMINNKMTPYKLLFDGIERNGTLNKTIDFYGIPTLMEITCSDNNGYTVNNMVINGHSFNNSGWVDIDSTYPSEYSRQYDLTNISNTFHIIKNKCSQVYYKPNNTQYATQGAVSSSARNLRLKLTTIEKHTANQKKQTENMYKMKQPTCSNNTYIRNHNTTCSILT